jgi:hypothetical protein
MQMYVISCSPILIEPPLQQSACQNAGECEKLKTGQFIEGLTEIRWY